MEDQIKGAVRMAIEDNIQISGLNQELFGIDEAVDQAYQTLKNDLEPEKSKAGSS